eukprot:RCo009548
MDNDAYIDWIYQQLERAFRFFEEKIRQGVLQRYGLASDGFLVADTSGKAIGRLDLQRCVDIARSVAGDGHHFGVVHLPLNLNEARFFLRPSPHQPGQSFIRWAKQQGLFVVAERPLQTFGLNSGEPYRYVEVLPPAETTPQASSPPAGPAGEATSSQGSSSLPKEEPQLRRQSLAE